MTIAIADALSPAEVAEVIEAGERAGPAPGIAAPLPGPVQARIAERLMAHAAFANLAVAKRIGALAYLRLEAGMAAPERHIAALAGLGGADPVRADLGLAIFLDGPGDCEGGALEVTARGAMRRLGLPAGACALYPAGDLAGFAKVATGRRRVVLGSVQSLVRGAAARDILGETWRALEYLGHLDHPDEAGRDGARRTLDKARQSLLRLWAEV